MAFVQKIYDSGLAQFVYYTAGVVDLIPDSGDTVPNHSGLGNLVADTHTVVSQTGSTLTISEEGVPVVVSTDSINFVGDGVLATSSSGQVTVTVTGTGSLGAHEATHQLGGGDAIDGDKLEITYAPSAYSRSLAAGLSTNVLHLTSHLKGINDALAGIPAAGEVNTASNLGGGTGWYQAKVGSDLQLKSAVAGYGIAITTNGTTENTLSAKTTVTTLTDVATVAVNADAGPQYELTVAGNRVLGNPTNATAGKRLEIIVSQDATGGRLLNFDSNWVPVGKTFQIAQAANAVSKITAVARGGTPKWYYLIEHTEFTEVTATQVTSDQIAWAPEGKGYANLIRISSNANARAIQGIVAPNPGASQVSFQTVLVGSSNLVIKHQDPGASNVNKIITPTQEDITLAPDSTIAFHYDFTSQRWRLV